jgi:ribose/xylose/arabinose/galactoside ABC-type transport system permease subunit
VEILRALAGQVRVIAFDEPTSSLSDHEVDALFALIRRLRDNGVAVGALNGVVIVYGQGNAVIATLATYSALRGLANLISDGRAQGYTGTDSTFVFIARGSGLGIEVDAKVVERAAAWAAEHDYEWRTPIRHHDDGSLAEW